MPPVRRLRRPTLHGTRAERDLRVRGRYGSAGVRGQEPRPQASHIRSPPWSRPMDLPGPSAQVGHGPHTGDERHRSARAQSRRSGGPGWAIRSLPAPAPSPMATPGSVNKAGPRVAPGGSRRAGNGAQRCFLHGVTRCFPRNSTVFNGYRCFGAESNSEHVQDSRDSQGATPRAYRGRSVHKVACWNWEGGNSSASRR